MLSELWPQKVTTHLISIYMICGADKNMPYNNFVENRLVTFCWMPTANN